MKMLDDKENLWSKVGIQKYREQNAEDISRKRRSSSWVWRMLTEVAEGGG